MKFSRIQILLICVLMLGTAIATTHYFELGMMGLTTFVLAYLSKGMRKPKLRSPD